MLTVKSLSTLFLVSLSAVLLTSCASHRQSVTTASNNTTMIPEPPPPDYSSRIPQKINTSRKVVVIDPNVHVWGAYNEQGDLIKAGLATAGSNWCADIKRPCRTRAGTFYVQSLGSPNCKSSIYPLPRGGAPMPYCMFFNGNQGMHGSPRGAVIEGNASHGCVRMHVADAEWLRYNFVNVGTKVVVKPY